MSNSSLFAILVVRAFEAMPQAAGADTVVAIPMRDGFDVIAAVTGGLIGATFLAVLLAFLFVLVQARRVSRALHDAQERFSADPGVEHLRRTAANVERISASLRDDVGRLSKSVGDLSNRLDQASARMEERIEEFNALMEVVQAEAEGVFVDTASTARGVRRGIGTLNEPRRSRRHDPTHRDGHPMEGSPDTPVQPAPESNPRAGSDHAGAADPGETLP